jgi:RNA polymerase sigma factor (TIGR02999 family)
MSYAATLSAEYNHVIDFWTVQTPYRPVAAMEQPPITQLLLAWRQGEKSALDELIPLVQTELKRIARNYMRRQSPGHTLQTTALVNEAFLRLVDSDRVNWQDRNHFFAICAQLMRRILVDFARRKNSLKLGPDDAGTMGKGR